MVYQTANTGIVFRKENSQGVDNELPNFVLLVASQLDDGLRIVSFVDVIGDECCSQGIPDYCVIFAGRQFLLEGFRRNGKVGIRQFVIFFLPEKLGKQVLLVAFVYEP